MSDVVTISAKLMANENISVVRAKVRTASFDVKSRRLTIPQFKDMNESIEDMLVCHEIGHALYTDYETMENFFAQKGMMKYHSYFNVVEDPRIERLVKQKYPGSRKAFRDGYRQLHELNFFKVNLDELDERSLGDRINLYYKGLSDKIVFLNQEEADLARRAGQIETMEEAFALAIEIYNYDKANFEQEQNSNYPDPDSAEENEEDGESEMMQSSPSEDDSEESSDENESQQGDNGEESAKEESADGEKSEKSEDGEGKDDSEDSDSEDSESIDQSENDGDDASGDFDPYANPEFEGNIESQKAFDDSVNNYVDCDKEYIDIEFSNVSNFCPIIGYKRVLQETKFAETSIPTARYSYGVIYDGIRNEEDYLRYVAEFKAEARDLIAYLKKEFDLKKSAEIIKRTVVNKTGQLDIRKLYAYKVSEDIFRRSTIIKDAKNHGMVFLLDWSSSMTSVMQKTIEQVYVLASFCKACNIPFRVFAFSSRYRSEHYVGRSADINNHDMTKLRPYTLLEFFNSAMTTEEFNTMANRLLRTTVWYSTESNKNGYDLYSTPLNSALAYMNFYLPEFKAKMNLEKVTLVTLTDGVSHSIQSNNNNWETYRRRYTFVSPITKKRYNLENSKVGRYDTVSEVINETRVLVEMLRDAGNIVVGLNISEHKNRDIQGALVACTAQYRNGESVEDAKKEDSYVVKNTFYDLCILFTRLLRRETDVELSDKLGEGTSKSIARQFIKVNKDKKRKRAFLDAFIATIA